MNEKEREVTYKLKNPSQGFVWQTAGASGVNWSLWSFHMENSLSRDVLVLAWWP